MGASECARTVAAGKRISEPDADSNTNSNSDPNSNTQSNAHTNSDSDAHTFRRRRRLRCGVERCDGLYRRHGGQCGQQQLHSRFLDAEPEPHDSGEQRPGRQWRPVGAPGLVQRLPQSHTNPDADANSYPHAKADANTHSNTNSQSNSDSFAFTNSNGRAAEASADGILAGLQQRRRMPAHQ
jgi:hypothetical protein